MNRKTYCEHYYFQNDIIRDHYAALAGSVAFFPLSELEQSSRAAHPAVYPEAA
jgi:hypothetical protein